MVLRLLTAAAVSGRRRFNPSVLRSPRFRSYSAMEVHPVPCLKDNYAYVIIDTATKQAVAVDPVEPHKVLSKINELGATLVNILTTHHHSDHAGGNAELRRLAPTAAAVVAGDERVAAITRLVVDGQEIMLTSDGDGDDGIRAVALHTPCHTRGSISFLVRAGKSASGAAGAAAALFSGDTLFIAGCGRFFEGTEHEMLGNLKRFNSLPQETNVYCGHEYTLADLEFARHVEPDNADVAAAISRLKRGDGPPCSVPMSLAQIGKINPFMRYTVPSVRRFALPDVPKETLSDSAHDALVVRVLRERKSAF